MEIRPLVLRQELMESYKAIQTQIEEVKKLSIEMGIEPHQLRDSKGNWVLVPLLAARVQVLHSLVLINQKEHH